jgi:hypothetical protein
VTDTLVPVRTRDDLKAGIRARKQAPDADHYRRHYPDSYSEFVNPKTGRTEWKCNVQTRDENGNLTAKGRSFIEDLKPFMAAESERGQSIKSRMPKPVPLRTQEGDIRHIHPMLADDAARANGWRSGSRPRGRPVMEGQSGGMLWKLLDSRWHPLGRRCLGTPLSGSPFVSKRGIQYDPSGRPWRWVAGEWRPCA